MSLVDAVGREIASDVKKYKTDVRSIKLARKALRRVRRRRPPHFPGQRRRGHAVTLTIGNTVKEVGKVTYGPTWRNKAPKRAHKPVWEPIVWAK